MSNVKINFLITLSSNILNLILTLSDIENSFVIVDHQFAEDFFVKKLY